MRVRQAFAFAVLGFCVIFGVLSNHAAESRGGDWTIRKSEVAGKVEFAIIEHRHGGTSDHSSDWPTSYFVGIDFSKAGRQDVRFTIARDAGKIECEGFLNDGEGAGIFHFQPDPNYAREMHALGFSIDSDEEKQFTMAVMDVSLDFARQMKNEHLDGLDADKLVAFRIHGVTPEMVRALRKDGYSPDEDKLVAMRIHGATPEWIADLKKLGYDRVDLDQLIAFRIHGVSPEFIAKLQGLGYAHPDPDELVAMRIHGVTPDYIAAMKGRGMQNLSIDQLVNMRIHGID